MSLDIPILKPQYIQRTIEQFTPDPKKFRGIDFCPVVPSNNPISWDIMMGVGGLIPPVVLDAESPRMKTPGMQQMSTSPGYFRGKSVFTEKDLTELRMPGTLDQIYGKKMVFDRLATMDAQIESTVEWFRWKSLSGIVPIRGNGLNFDVDYKIPTHFKPTAGVAWSDTANADPLVDIATWKALMIGTGLQLKKFWFTSVVEKYLLFNAVIRDITKRSVTNGRVTKDVLTELMGDYEVYDQGYTIQAQLTASAAKDAVTIILDDATGIEIGDKITLNMGMDNEERVTISEIDNTVLTISALASSKSVGATASTFKTFIPNDKFIMKSEPFSGNSMEFATVPSLFTGLDNPKPGKFTKIVDLTDVDRPSVEVIGGIYGAVKRLYKTDCIYADVA